ncbi:F-box/LRR-repeat protein 2-like [Candoia aspera]|uniref:F-box/LRR-repeat protein 2-like n=1 Tax=Candoia aspera TaxID=51853 RepID=UPI002FD86265
MLTHKDISQISQVCHRFYQLAGDKLFWKKIQLKDCHCLNDDWLISLGKHHPERFTLDHCHDKDQRISEVGLKQFFQYCEGFLKELNIKNCSGSGFKGDRVLLHASTFCHNLAVVDISWTGATDLGLIALVKASRSLQCFSANGCQITNDSIISLIGKHGKSLKKLEIFGCHAVTDKCLKSIAMKCPGLEVLNIGRVHRITQDCLVEMVNSLQKLTSLNITGLEMMRDCLVHCILMKCPKLECLVLNSCAHITDISLIEISTYLPMIRYLDVNGCKYVTDTGVQALTGNCHKLSYLDLSSTATSKRGVCLLANFCFSTLECLKLSFCRNISLDAVAKLCKNCKRLRMLHLYGCRFIPDLESIKKVNKTVKIFHDLPVATVKLPE